MNHSQNSKTKRQKDREMVYQLEGRPGLSTAVPLGLQHVLAMFTSNLAPILIIASVCGLSGNHGTMCNVCFRTDNFYSAVSH